jgi:transposase InsO family protein
MALKARAKEKQSINGLILHSDGGGQYYSKAFLELTKKACIINSMCYYPWDNSYAERLNGTIKNNYLKYKNIKTYQGLVKEVDRTVYLYNHDKPHINLKRKTPVQFENDYFSNGQQSDDEKSTTELNVLNPVGISALRAEDNNPSDSNIAQELIYPKIEN